MCQSAISLRTVAHVKATCGRPHGTVDQGQQRLLVASKITALIAQAGQGQKLSLANSFSLFSPVFHANISDYVKQKGVWEFTPSHLLCSTPTEKHRAQIARKTTDFLSNISSEVCANISVRRPTNEPYLKSLFHLWKQWRAPDTTQALITETL